MEILNTKKLNLENYWGIYQEYYISTNYFNTSTFNVSLVGSLAVGMTMLSSLFTAPLMSKYGYKKLLYFGTVLCNLGILITSWTKNIWQVYLTLGIMFGIGGSFPAIISMSIPPLWFKKNRSLAMGICSSGSGIGGLVISILSRQLINKLGVEWSLFRYKCNRENNYRIII